MCSERIQLPLHRERTYGKNRRTTVKNLSEHLVLLCVFSWRRSQNRFFLSVIVLDRDCNDDSKPGDGGRCRRSSWPGGPRGLLPWGSRRSVLALSRIRLLIS